MVTSNRLEKTIAPPTSYCTFSGGLSDVGDCHAFFDRAFACMANASALATVFRGRGDLFINWVGVNDCDGSRTCVGPSVGGSGRIYFFYPANNMVSGGITYGSPFNDVTQVCGKRAGSV